MAQAQTPAALNKAVVQRTRQRLKAPKRQPAEGITLGRLIAAERHRQGLTQFDVSRAVACREKMIYYLETDRSTYWVKLREIIEFLAPRAGKLWLKQSTQLLMGKIDAMVWEESDPVKRLMLAEWLRSSGDRATATSTDMQQGSLPGFTNPLREPQIRPRLAS